MEITLKLTGTNKLVQHNIRMANPLNQYVRELKEYTSKQRKTDDDYAAMIRIESRGSCYDTPDGMLGLPTANVWRAIAESATKFKKGKLIKEGLLFDDVVVPVIIDGRPWRCEEYLTAETIDYRAVGVSRAKTMRARPMIPAGWQTTHVMQLDETVLNVRDMGQILERAGKYVGLCERHPLWGTFTCEMVGGTAGLGMAD